MTKNKLYEIYELKEDLLNDVFKTFNKEEIQIITRYNERLGELIRREQQIEHEKMLQEAKDALKK